jgi:3-hydroxybutyryl-CoA dehydratase
MTSTVLPADIAAGDRFATSGRTVTESDVVGFAALTGDWHPQHADAVWAASSPFGERIAHGMLVLSFAVGLVPLDPERVLALRRVRDATFKRPVKLGDTIHVEGRVDEVKPIDAATAVVALAWSVINQDGKTVTRAVVEVVWRTGDAAQGGRADVDGAAEEPIAGVLPL